MLSITSGRAPDVALGVAGSSPVEFAIRDAVVDLKSYPDFPEIEKRFVSKIMVPFYYRGGCYALPETMNFTVLFYRKDIINELGIRIPDTWQDLYEHVLPILYQNGMEFYFPVSYAPFLYQYDGRFYNEEGTKSALDTPEAFQAFKAWTELYTGYGVPAVANFYNRMRTGEMPMGIHGYQTYMRLAVAAPELFGRWGIAQVPGRRMPDGSVNRAVGGIPGSAARGSAFMVTGLTGEAVIVLNQSKVPKEGWEFIKWWTNVDMQADFGRELEAIMGVEARWNTANKEAFKRLPWKRDDIAVITKQWQWYQMAPVVLGGYFTPRHIMNAWNRVVLGSMTVRDSLEQMVKDINVELRSKQEEYGFAVD